MLAWADLNVGAEWLSAQATGLVLLVTATIRVLITPPAISASIMVVIFVFITISVLMTIAIIVGHNDASR